MMATMRDAQIDADLVAGLDEDSGGEEKERRAAAEIRNSTEIAAADRERDVLETHRALLASGRDSLDGGGHSTDAGSPFAARPAAPVDPDPVDPDPVDPDPVDPDPVDLQSVVDMLLEKEEALMTRHMACIEESADLLAEEGALLGRVQGQDVVDYDIDAYASRLEEILERKMGLCSALMAQLQDFRASLAEEEAASRGTEDAGADVQTSDVEPLEAVGGDAVDRRLADLDVDGSRGGLPRGRIGAARRKSV
jgi:hypothetical protein